MVRTLARLLRQLTRRLRPKRRVLGYDDLTRVGATPESRALVSQNPHNYGTGVNGAGGGFHI